MFASIRRFGSYVLGALSFMVLPIAGAAGTTALPPPAVDLQSARGSESQTAVFAGGCFWGVEAVFRHTKGVSSAVSGYAGGSPESAKYDKVSSGGTGHAESVQIKYDPKQVSFGQLLQIFFSVAHDPTQLNRQGPDVGTQYRSAVFYLDEEQKRVTQAYVQQLDKAKVLGRPIVTQVTPLKAFYPAEAYHQNYAALNPSNPYIVINDLPKVANLQKQFPDRYKGQK